MQSALTFKVVYMLHQTIIISVKKQLWDNALAIGNHPRYTLKKDNLLAVGDNSQPAGLFMTSRWHFRKWEGGALNSF